MAKVTNKIKDSDGTSHYIASTAYCVCDTAANVAAKVANVIGDQADNSNSAVFSLIKGTTIHVKFTNSNTAASPTLSVGGTTAKPIIRYGTTAVGTDIPSSWAAGSVVELTYDGTSWVENGGDKGEIVKITFSSISSLPQTVNNSKITADHEVVFSKWETPDPSVSSSAVISEISWDTYDGSMTISGTISGTTTLVFYLAIPTT